MGRRRGVRSSQPTAALGGTLHLRCCCDAPAILHAPSSQCLNNQDHARDAFPPVLRIIVSRLSHVGACCARQSIAVYQIQPSVRIRPSHWTARSHLNHPSGMVDAKQIPLFHLKETPETKQRIPFPCSAPPRQGIFQFLGFSWHKTSPSIPRPTVDTAKTRSSGNIDDERARRRLKTPRTVAGPSEGPPISL